MTEDLREELLVKAINAYNHTITELIAQEVPLDLVALGLIIMGVRRYQLLGLGVSQIATIVGFWYQLLADETESRSDVKQQYILPLAKGKH